MGKKGETETARQKQAMLKALDAHYGNVRIAADATGIAPSTHYRWRQEDDDYESSVAYIKDISFNNIKDALVTSAIEKIKNGDTKVLNKMLGIYLKKLPEEMEKVSSKMKPKVEARIKYVAKPPGWDKMVEEMKQKHGLE